MGLWHSFQEGGWAMYPIFAFGLLGVGAAGRFAWRGEHPLLGFIRWIVVTVLLCGVFGTLVGIMRMLSFTTHRLATMTWVPDLPTSEKRLFILLEGTREALNCVSGALMFAVVICLLGAIGHRRFPLPNLSSTAS